METGRQRAKRLERSKNLDRGISLDKDGRYRVRVSFEGRQYECGRYETLTLARAANNRYQLEAIQGTFVSPAERRRLEKKMREEERAAKLTVAQWAEIWLDSLREGSNPRSEGTVTAYRSNIQRHILPDLGHVSLVDLNERLITPVLDQIEKRGASARDNTIRTLRAMLNSAVKAKAGGLTASPLDRVDLPEPIDRVRGGSEIPTLQEVRTLTEAMAPKYRLSVQLGAWCQLRLGEVLGLQRGDFRYLDDPDRAELSVERQWNSKASPPAYTGPKEGSVRVLAIPPALVPIIVAHLDQFVADSPEAPVFPSVTSQWRPVGHTTFRKAWNEARASVNLKTSFHALRHFGLTVYAQQGATIKEIMARGGHRDPETAQRYQHAAAERDKQMAAQLGAMIGVDQ